MPKILKLDMKPGEYGLEFENIMRSALRKCRNDMSALDAYMQWYAAEKARIDSDFAYLTTACRMDANEAAFFARQLEYIKARTYDIVYPEFTIQKFLTITSEGGAGVETITSRQYESVGQMKLIGPNVKDIPRSDTFAREGSIGVKTFATMFGYSIDEIEKAMFAGVPLEQRKANAARRAYDQTVNELGYLANGSEPYGGIRGLFYQENIINTETDSIPITGNWCDPYGASVGTTPEQIIEDIGLIIDAPRIVTKKVERTNKFLMPVPAMSYIKRTKVSSVSDTTIFQFVKANHPEIDFQDVNECSGLIKPSAPTGTDTTDICCAFDNSADKIDYSIPMTFNQMPVEVRGMEYTTICRARIAGVDSHYPKSIVIAEDIIKRVA